MSTEIHNYPDANFSPNSSQNNSDEIDLRELFSVIWQGKWIIIAITTVFTIGSVIFAINQPNIYKSEALLAPADTEQGGGLAALAGQFGGLASMAGINLGGGGGVDKTQMAIEVMKSRQFTSSFIQKHNILADLIAPEKWDMTNNAIIYDEELYSAAEQKWVRQVQAPFQPVPSMQEAYKQFSKIMTVDAAKETGMVTVTVEHLSPAIAQQWVSWLVADINKEMKTREVAEANRSIDFLQKQIQQTNVADIRTILYKLVEEQAKTVMFAEVRDEYVFKTIDPAFVPEEKFKPKRLIIVVVGAVFGFFLSIATLLFRRNFCL